MARRGDPLRRHILWTAKDVFLELGFERASMDVVSTRADTSKRTLYAHFESKENLYLAVVELVRGLILDRLGNPHDYSDDPTEGLVLFCGRYLEILRYEPSIRMCRLIVSETERFPQGAAQHYDAVFTQVEARVGAHLAAAWGWSVARSGAAAERLVGRLLYPRLLRGLFGLDELAKGLDQEPTDLTPIREAIAELFEP